MRTISFTTDYGLSDAFVAICHGVALGIAPGVRIVDVTHLVPLADVRRGAAVLADAVPYLPEGTVHVAVVDPGVGTSRRAVVVEAPRGLLVGPDNGLLLPAADALGGATTAVEITTTAPARTFHGRDLFMPVAARLAAGASIGSVGPAVEVSSLVRLPTVEARSGQGWLEAEVRSTDQFGSLQLAASAAALHALVPVGGSLRLSRPDAREPAVVAVRAETFGDVPAGALLVLVDSTGRPAVSVNRGSAADRLGVAAGDVLRLATAPPER